MTRVHKASMMMRVLALVCAGVVMLALVGCGSPDMGGTPPTAPSATPSSAGATVVIKDFAFTPATVTIKVGDTVTWRNEDGVPHDATSDTWTSGSISSGESYTMTFDKPGTYTYMCKVHPSMTPATIIVQ